MGANPSLDLCSPSADFWAMAWHRSFAFRLWTVVPAGLAAACGGQPSSDESATPVAACSARTFEGSTFTVCPYDFSKDDLRLAWKGRAGTAMRGFAALESELGSDASRLRFAMNAGMFDEEGAPIGLYVESGRRLKRLNLKAGPGNFHMKPNGVFAVDRDGSVSVTPSASFRQKVGDPLWATQSGPMLVIDGRLHPRFAHDGASRLVRNGVGVRDGRTAWFVISEEGVSFGRMGRFFRDALACRNALFLDGTVSRCGIRPRAVRMPAPRSARSFWCCVVLLRRRTGPATTGTALDRRRSVGQDRIMIRKPIQGGTHACHCAGRSRGQDFPLFPRYLMFILSSGRRKEESACRSRGNDKAIRWLWRRTIKWRA